MDIEGNRRGSRRRRDVIWSDISCFSTDLFSSISSLVCQGYELLCEYKKLALAVFFVMLETTSLVLDVFGQSRKSIHLAAFLLSVFGFVMTILTCMLERTRLPAEKQLGVVEICFSVVQLIDTFLPVLGIKINNNYTAPVLILVFAIINAVFTFIKDENILGSLSLTNEYENELLSNENELQVNENELLSNENELQLMETDFLENSSTIIFQNVKNIYRVIRPFFKLSFVEVDIPSMFDFNPTNWKCLLVKLMKNYNSEVEFCGAGGKLRLDYPEDADNKLLHGDDEWDNKLNMGVKNISMRQRRREVDKIKTRNRDVCAELGGREEE